MPPAIHLPRVNRTGLLLPFGFVGRSGRQLQHRRMLPRHQLGQHDARPIGKAELVVVGVGLVLRHLCEHSRRMRKLLGLGIVFQDLDRELER